MSICDSDIRIYLFADSVMALFSRKRKNLCEMSDKYFRRISKNKCTQSPRTEVIENNRQVSSVPNISTSDQQTDTIISQDSIPCISVESVALIPVNYSEAPTQDHISNDPEENEEKSCQEIEFSSIFLAQWAVRNNISHVATNDLLSLLRTHKCFQNFPKCSKTLLKTPRSTEIVSMFPGHYCHFGLRWGLERFLNAVDDFSETVIDLQIGIDGLPLWKSSSVEFWPILCRIVGTTYVFCIGCYCGEKKPGSANEFLASFVNEITSLIKDGLSFRGTLFPIRFQALIADAPPKSYVCQTKGHTGYNSCSKCLTEGIYISNRIAFPDLNCAKRTDESFKNQSDDSYHAGTSVLSEIPHFGPVSAIPLEYMHLVCLGIILKMIKNWLSGPVKNRVRLPACSILEISQQLRSMRAFTPAEFCRKPRGLTEIAHWKATEFRMFLLYVGVLVLREALSPEFFLHFKKLYVAIRLYILARPGDIEIAESLLKEFIVSFGLIYGKESISHNIHGLIHVADDVRRFGSLDNYSAFVFENHLQKMKNLIKKGDKPLQQLNNRYRERFAFLTEIREEKRYPILKGSHSEGPTVTSYDGVQFRKAIFEKFSVERKFPNNCFGLKTTDEIVIIDNIVQSNEELYAIGRKFDRKSDLFDEPCASSLVLTFQVANLSRNTIVWRLSELTTKYFIVPYKDSYAVTALIHSNRE